MKNIDLDRAFPKTPDCIHAAIEMGFRKGQNKMKMRNKMIAMTSAAAALLIMIAVAALAMGIDPEPAPDVLAQPPITLEPVQDESLTVYTTEKALYYHANEVCSGLENPIAVPEKDAIEMGKQNCPVCIPLICTGHDREKIEFIYYSQGGLYFHRQQECSGGEMPLKGDYFETIQEFPEKEACPVCFPNGIEVCRHGYAFAVEPEPTEIPALIPAEESNAEPTASKKASSSSKSASPTTVYYNEAGQYFHSDEHCMGMMNASAHSREEAQRSGKPGCPYCLKVYCTESGSFFHLFPDCIGMQGASLHNVQDARKMKIPKTRCAACLNPAKVYATEKGNYCHAIADCSGMQGASAMPLDFAVVEKGKNLCPVCIAFNTIELDELRWESSDAVFYAADQIYYHSDTTCLPGIDISTPHTVTEARAAGRLACHCVAVWFSEDGGFYHALRDCMGGGYNRIGNMQEASDANNQRCPICLSPQTVYATKTGKYFHLKNNCRGMQGAIAITPEDGWAAGKTPCSVCITESMELNQNLHYTLFDKAFGNLEQAAAARYGFMEKADGSWRLTDGSKTAAVSRLGGINSETHPEVKYCLQVTPYDSDNPAINDPDASDVVQKSSTAFMNSIKALPMMTMYSSAVNAVKKHLANDHPGNEEALFSHVYRIDVYFDESLEIYACEMYFPCATHSVHVQITQEEKSADDITWRVNTQLNTGDITNGYTSILETAAAKAKLN